MRGNKGLAACAVTLLLLSACAEAETDKATDEVTDSENTEAAPAAQAPAAAAQTEADVVPPDDGGSQDLPELEMEDVVPPDDGGSQDDYEAAGEP